ncbi:hypothetical protein [Cryobacterium suzukii]|nr:hypothetical protein [Cryobacterium suzukii]
MFILFLLLTALGVAAIVATIRSVRRDGYGRRAPRIANEYDALVR